MADAHAIKLRDLAEQLTDAEQRKVCENAAKHIDQLRSYVGNATAAWRMVLDSAMFGAVSHDAMTFSEIKQSIKAPTTEAVDG